MSRSPPHRGSRPRLERSMSLRLRRPRAATDGDVLRTQRGGAASPAQAAASGASSSATPSASRAPADESPPRSIAVRQHANGTSALSSDRASAARRRRASFQRADGGTARRGDSPASAVIARDSPMRGRFQRANSVRSGFTPRLRVDSSPSGSTSAIPHGLPRSPRPSPLMSRKNTSARHFFGDASPSNSPGASTACVACFRVHTMCSVDDTPPPMPPFSFLF